MLSRAALFRRLAIASRPAARGEPAISSSGGSPRADPPGSRPARRRMKGACRAPGKGPSGHVSETASESMGRYHRRLNLSLCPARDREQVVNCPSARCGIQGPSTVLPLASLTGRTPRRRSVRPPPMVARTVVPLQIGCKETLAPDPSRSRTRTAGRLAAVSFSETFAMTTPWGRYLNLELPSPSARGQRVPAAPGRWACGSAYQSRRRHPRRCAARGVVAQFSALPSGRCP